MESCDTNIFYYAFNPACDEHSAADQYLKSKYTSKDFAVCELVLIELYVLLRSPRLNPQPAPATEAGRVIEQLRANPHWALIDYPGGLMDPIWKHAAKPKFAYRKIFDMRLAETLMHHGIELFVTRNTKDFGGYSFCLHNPID